MLRKHQQSVVIVVSLFRVSMAMVEGLSENNK